MGNAGSGIPRERQKSGETAPPSPGKEEQAFVFNRQPEKLVYQSSHEDDEQPYFTKPISPNYEATRPRANTVSEGTKITVGSKQALPTVFRWEGGGTEVLISGTFSEWKTIPMVKSHSDFVTIIDLPEGDHQYKFCVDGEWKHDTSLKIVDNGMGSKNNMVSVKQSDFEVFQALAKDSEGGLNDGPKDYSQEIPPTKPWEKVSGPPILPPHLLQVILNKDTPLSVSI